MRTRVAVRAVARLPCGQGLQSAQSFFSLPCGQGCRPRSGVSACHAGRGCSPRSPFQLAVRAGVAVRALVACFSLPCGQGLPPATWPRRAVAYFGAVRAGVAGRAVVLHLAVRTRRALHALVLLPAMRTPLLPHRSRSMEWSAFPPHVRLLRAPRRARARGVRERTKSWLFKTSWLFRLTRESFFKRTRNKVCQGRLAFLPPR